MSFRLRDEKITLLDYRNVRTHYLDPKIDRENGCINLKSYAGYGLSLPVEFIDEEAPVEVVFTAPKDPKTPDELLKWVHVRLGEVEVMDPKILGVRGREQEGTPHQLKIREYQAARDEIQGAIARFYNQEPEQ